MPCRLYVKIYKRYLHTSVFTSCIFCKNVNSSEFVTRMWTTDYFLSHENAVSFREHTQTCISIMFLLLQWPSLHSGKCHCRFHRAIHNWSQVRNEQLASPTLGMHLWHNELRPSDNDDHDDYDNYHVDEELREGHAQRRGGRMGPRSRSKGERRCDIIMLVL